MTPKEWLISTDKEINQAVSNGYDIRLDEDELLTKMNDYHQAKLKLLGIPNVRLSCLQEVWQAWCESDKVVEFDKWLHDQMHGA